MWIEELSNGKYKYFERYTDPLTEKQKRVSVILSKKTPQAKKEAQRLLDEKIEIKLNTLPTDTLTYKQLRAEFWHYYPQTVKHTTAVRHRANDELIQNYIVPNVLIKNIDSPFLQRILDDLYYKKNYSFSTIKQVKSLMRGMFGFAVKNGYLKTNVALSLELKRKREEIVSRIEDKFLEKEEADLLIHNQYIYSNNKRYAAITEFMLLTGLRYGELAALREENFHGDYIEVCGTIDFSRNVSETIKTTPKTKTGFRQVLLNQRTKEIIIEALELNQLMKSNFAKDDGYIFCSDNGYPFSNVNYNRSLQKAAKASGITKNVSSHILRHSHISYLVEMGVDIKTIMDRVGHSKPEVTLSIYSHVTERMKSNLSDKLESLMF